MRAEGMRMNAGTASVHDRQAVGPSSTVPTDTWAAFGRDHLLYEQVQAFHARRCFQTAIETGTWKGHTTVALAALFPNVHTIEIDRERFQATLPRFDDHPNVTAHCGSSPDVLLKLVSRIEYPLFALLDAHWGEDWPLRDELKILLSVRRPKLICIHDFKVPGRDFGYDCYAGQECSLDYIADLLPHGDCRYTFNSHVAPNSEQRGALFIEHLFD
jgi:hypothetical protein